MVEVAEFIGVKGASLESRQHLQSKEYEEYETVACLENTVNCLETLSGQKLNPQHFLPVFHWGNETIKICNIY